MVPKREEPPSASSNFPLNCKNQSRAWTSQHKARNNQNVDAIRPQPKPQRLLGAYLFGLCFYQIAVYSWPGGPPFVLDPRAGIPILLINHLSFDNKVIYPVEWITATWLVLIAALFFFRGTYLTVYPISELVLAAPTAYYIGMLAVQHGGDFAPGFKDLLVTAALFSIFSLIPVVWVSFIIVKRRAARA